MLKQAIRICFFSLSLFLLAAHSLLPHNHNQATIHDHAALPAWIDFLADIVGTNDLGEDHLEDYDFQASNLKISNPFVFCFLTSTTDYAALWSGEFQPAAFDSRAISKFDSLWQNVLSFRGPPAA